MYVLRLTSMCLYLSLLCSSLHSRLLILQYIPHSRPLCYVEVMSVLKLLEAPVPLVYVASEPPGRPPLAGFVPVVAPVALHSVSRCLFRRSQVVHSAQLVFRHSSHRHC